jgi:hypothetical protein
VRRLGVGAADRPARSSPSVVVLRNLLKLHLGRWLAADLDDVPYREGGLC